MPTAFKYQYKHFSPDYHPGLQNLTCLPAFFWNHASRDQPIHTFRLKGRSLGPVKAQSGMKWSVLTLMLVYGFGQPEVARILYQNEDVLTNFSNFDCLT